MTRKRQSKTDIQKAKSRRYLAQLSPHLVEPAVPLEPSVGVLLLDPAGLLPHLEGAPALGLVLVHALVIQGGGDLRREGRMAYEIRYSATPWTCMEAAVRNDLNPDLLLDVQSLKPILGELLPDFGPVLLLRHRRVDRTEVRAAETAGLKKEDDVSKISLLIN